MIVIPDPLSGIQDFRKTKSANRRDRRVRGETNGVYFFRELFNVGWLNADY